MTTDDDDEDVEPRRRQGVVVGAGGWKIFQALSMQLYIQYILNSFPSFHSKYTHMLLCNHQRRLLVCSPAAAD
jgi:hypothetical protein